MNGYRVTESIRGAHPKHTKYPLLEDDLLVKQADGTWTKECPGLLVSGFELTPEQEATLIPVEYENDGLYYAYVVHDG